MRRHVPRLKPSVLISDPARQLQNIATSNCSVNENYFAQLMNLFNVLTVRDDIVQNYHQFKDWYLHVLFENVYYCLNCHCWSTSELIICFIYCQFSSYLIPTLPAICLKRCLKWGSTSFSDISSCEIKAWALQINCRQFVWSYLIQHTVY